MADTNTTRRLIRGIQAKPAPILTGRVLSVDALGMTAVVKLGNSPSAVRLQIVSSSLAGRLASLVQAGQQPTVTVNERNMIEGTGGAGVANPVTTTTVIVSGIDVTTLNSDFYAHIADPDAHHTAFIGLTDDSSTVVNPNVSDRIQIRGTGGVTITAGTSELVATINPAYAFTWTAQHQFAPSTVATAPFTLGANAQGQLVTGLYADQLNKTITAGNGLTGGGLLTANRTINVGSGNGITVGTDDVAVNQGYAFIWTAQHTYNMPSAQPPFVLNSNAQGQTVVGLRADQLNKSVIAGAGLTGGGLLTADRTLDVGAGTGIAVAADSVAVDQTFSPTWSGNHVWTNTNEFQNTLLTRTLLPGSGTSDIGSSLFPYRSLYVSEIQATTYAENTIQIIGGEFYVSKGGGSIDVAINTVVTQVDFGRAMTTGDFVQFKTATQSEYMTIGSNVSGTIYNVTRDVDGSGPNSWPLGSVYVIYGQSGNGFIRLGATTTPQINLLLQGATWSDRTEMIRIGDLNGWGDIATTNFGIAIGRYASNYPNFVIDQNGVVKLRRFTTDILRFDLTANYIANPLLLDTAGGIFQGTGTFASPTRGLKLYNSGGFGVLEGYNAGVVQAAFNSNGEITWLGGLGKLNADGVQIQTDTSFNFNRGYRFIDGSGNLHSGAFAYQTPGATTTHIELYATSTSNTAESVLYAESNSGAVAGFVRVRATGLGTTTTVSTGTTQIASGVVTVDATTSLSLGTAAATATTVAGTSAAINPTTLNLGTATTTALTIGRSGVVANTAGPWVHTNAATSIPTFSGDGLYLLSNTSNRGLDGLYNRISSTSYQLSIPHVTAFPASPPTGHTVFRTDYRCLWNYDGSTWRQVSIGTFSGSFPSSPQDKMRVFRSDRNIEYFWNNASAEWLSTDIFEATGIGDVRTFAPYPNTLTVATAVLTYHVDNTTYSVRVVDSYITSMVTGTNNGTNYWNYNIGYANNNGGGGVTLVSGNTSAAATNSTTKITISDVTITSNATAGRVAVTLNVTGTPTSYTIRGVIKYRLVG